MDKASLRNAGAWGLKAARRFSPWTLKKFFYYGAAASCSVGVGLGLWLEPPEQILVKPGSMSPAMVQLPEAPQVEPVAVVSPPTSYAWYQPAVAKEEAVVEPAVEPEPPPQQQPQPHLISQAGPPIQLGAEDPDDRARQEPTRYQFRDYRRRDDDLDDRDRLSGQDEGPPPPRSEPRWPSRDGGESWRRDDGG